MPQQRSTYLRTIPLDLEVKQEAVINGIEMGVLDNGIPYLTKWACKRLWCSAIKD
ncbi:Uncharacterised protein [Klebsiella pneumoniae]|nr:Uncharacterised protein [Klebsiella pneumoniae]